MAAGHCLGTIAEHFLHHTPDTLREAITKGEPDIRTDVKNENASADGGQIPVTALLSFATFDVRAVLDQGTPLLASGGDEFDAPQVAAGDAGGLAQQRSNLKKRLGLGGGMEAFVDTGDLITDEDLVVGPAPIKVEEPQKKTGAPELLMSVRERAAAARNAKLAKRKGPVGGGPAQDSKRAKGANGQANANPSTSNQDQDLLDAEAAEQEWQAVLAGRWPFQQLCDRLLVDLLHPQWEVRHGAALALRDILRSQAASAGVHAPVADPPLGWSVAGGKGRLQLGPVSSADIAAARAGNASWLEDCAIHMLCTLALDRFGDYLSDQVVAPVRETTAQALGATARALDPTVVASLVEALCTLAQCSEWEARHGGLQGLKYVLAAQDEISAQLFSAALPASVTGLRDRDDDVRAVAAEALLPVAHLLAADASPEGAHALRLLWDTLLTLEDLSPATKGATTLLAAVYSCAASTPGGGVLGEHSQPLASLVPRLWPHLHHPLSSVRVAATKCLAALMRSQPMEALLPGEELVRAGRLLFQSFLVEEDEAVLAQSEEAWRVLVSATPPALLRASFTSVDLAALFKLASTPPHRKYDATLMVAVALPGAGADGMPALHPSGSSAKTSGDAARATRMRMAAARALGQLAGAMGDGGDNPTLPHVIQAIGGPSAAERILGGSIVAQWACQRSGEPGQGLQQAAQAALSQLEARPVQFVELAKPYSHVEQQARSLMTLASSKGLALPPLTAPFTVEAALAVATQAATGGKEVAVAAQALESSATALQVSQSVLQASAASALAAAVVHVGLLPAKLNSLIQPLIAATRREPQPLLQDQGAAALAQLAVSASTRKPSPTDKVIKNVCGFATGDPAAVPSAAAPPALGEDGEAQPAAAAKKGKGGNEDAATAASTAAAEAAALTRRVGSFT